MEKRYYGKYRGVVQNNIDPLKLGRVKCIVPDVSGNEELPWANIGNAPIQGMFFVPNIGDYVWIEFESGNINLPIYTAAWYKNNQIANKMLTSYPSNRVIQTTSGASIEVNDASGDITITGSAGNFIKVDPGGAIQISNPVGSEVIVDASGSIKINSAVDINIQSISSLKINSTSVMNIQSNGTMTISSTGVVNISGTSVNLG